MDIHVNKVTQCADLGFWAHNSLCVAHCATMAQTFGRFLAVSGPPSDMICVDRLSVGCLERAQCDDHCFRLFSLEAF